MSAAPPYWQIDVQKLLGTEYWTNVYHVAASSQATAMLYAEAIVDLERQSALSSVQFVRNRVAPFPGPSEGTIIPIGLVGVVAGDGWLPLFNVVRVDFPAPTGRPSRKYYRLPLAESAQTNGVLDQNVRAIIQGRFDAYFASPNSSGLIDIDGQLLVSARVMSNVGMRQLRRGSKRRLQPVIPIA